MLEVKPQLSQLAIADANLAKSVGELRQLMKSTTQFAAVLRESGVDQSDSVTQEEYLELSNLVKFAKKIIDKKMGQDEDYEVGNFVDGEYTLDKTVLRIGLEGFDYFYLLKIDNTEDGKSICVIKYKRNGEEEVRDDICVVDSTLSSKGEISLFSLGGESILTHKILYISKL